MADKKNTLSQEFDRIQGKIETLFRPIYDPIDEFFFKLVAEFQKAGVDFLEVNQGKKSAIAKHSNYYEYPERRYAVTVNDKNKVKFYELEYSNSEAGDSPTAKEISQKEFEDLTIPTYLKPNPLMSKEDQEQDKTPDEADYPEGTKKKEDKDAINKEKPTEHPEIKKKTVEYGDTLSPKNKKEKVDEAVKPSFAVGLDRAKRPAANQGHTVVTPDTYTGTVGNLGPMEESEDLSGGYQGYQIKSNPEGWYIEDAGGTPVPNASGIINSAVAKAWVDALIASGKSSHDYLKKRETIARTSATPTPGLTDGRPGDYPNDDMSEDRASKFAKDKQGISITADQRKAQELRKKKDAKKKGK